MNTERKKIHFRPWNFEAEQQFYAFEIGIRTLWLSCKYATHYKNEQESFLLSIEFHSGRAQIQWICKRIKEPYRRNVNVCKFKQTKIVYAFNHEHKIFQKIRMPAQINRQSGKSYVQTKFLSLQYFNCWRHKYRIPFFTNAKQNYSNQSNPYKKRTQNIHREKKSAIFFLLFVRL